MLKSRHTLPVLFLFVMLLITSCKDNPTSFSEEPPQLPSEQSMTMDMSELDGQGTQSKALNGRSLQADDAFQNAVFRASIMRLVVDINLLIPRALLTAASATDAEFNDEGEWEWAFSRTVGNETFSVRLVASEADNDQTQWEFYVSSSQYGISDLLFFSGLSNSDGTEGIWTYYSLDPESTNEPVSSLEWSVNGEDDVYLRLEVLSDWNDNLGDYLEYTFDGTIKRAIYYDASEDATTEIQWNVETNAGYLIAPDYNNGVKACWDSNFQDTTCEE